MLFHRCDRLVLPDKIHLGKAVKGTYIAHTNICHYKKQNVYQKRDVKYSFKKCSVSVLKKHYPSIVFGDRIYTVQYKTGKVGSM